MLKNYLTTSLTSCENLKLIKPGVLNPDLALLFIPLCGPLSLRRMAEYDLDLSLAWEQLAADNIDSKRCLQ